MKTIALIVLLLIAGAAGLTLYKIRGVQHDPAVWHVDPLTAEASTSPNHFRVAPDAMTEQEVDMEAPVLTGNITEIAQAFDDFVLSQRYTERIAGSVAEGWMTYVQLTPRLRIPDYVSVKFIQTPVPEKVTLAIFSRSRFGYGDMGVNEARVKIWLSSLDAFSDE